MAERVRHRPKSREAEQFTRPTFIVISGLPGRMATAVAKEAMSNKDYFLLHTGVAMEPKNVGRHQVQGREVTSVSPHALGNLYGSVKKGVVIDFSHAGKVDENGGIYTKLKLPFIMGAGEGDTEALARQVVEKDTLAVITHDTALEVAAIEEGIDGLAKASADGLTGWQAAIRESHPRKGITPTSRAWQKQLEEARATVEGVDVVTDPQQRDVHAYHWLTLTDPNGREIAFESLLDGREAHVRGTLAAARFLSDKMRAGEKGKVYTMRDVLRSIL